MTSPGRVVDLALSRPASLGRSRLVCVDGPAGSGKTTFAGAVVDEAAARRLTAALVHMDDVYAGWDGLPSAGDRVRRLVVEPLTLGRSGGFARYDWHRQAWAEQVVVPPADLVVVEGVGSGHVGYAERITVLVWVEAPAGVRLRRGLERDGEAMRPQWLRWREAEDRLHRAERTRERADVLVDGAAPVSQPASQPASQPD